MKQTDAFLSISTPRHRERIEDWLLQSTSWEDLRDAFLTLMIEYGKELCGLADDWDIHSHEAGGAWRPLFFHLEHQDHEQWKRKMAAVMRERRRYAQRTFHHGFPDEAEIHHEIETFLYFQMPLWHQRLLGHELALDSILDLSEHILNAVNGVPAWYDWEHHRFRSTYLGTRSIRDYMPFDYQEGNHWRFAGVALTAYHATKDKSYLDMVEGYARTWCKHIQAAHARGEVIRCSILPDGKPFTEMNFSGTQNGTQREYEIFYCTVSANTAYDIACGLLDVYQTTGKEECRCCAGWLIDQFFHNHLENRPASFNSKGVWKRDFDPHAKFSLKETVSQTGDFLARMALKYDISTGESRYKTPIVAWAGAIDEERWLGDQTMIAPLIAAWYYTKETGFLSRAYAMALRLWAVTMDLPEAHMCSAMNRYGSKFLMETCYFPVTGRWDAGTRGHLPQLTNIHPN